jgi:hypothetical protein
VNAAFLEPFQGMTGKFHPGFIKFAGKNSGKVIRAFGGAGVPRCGVLTDHAF